MELSPSMVVEVASNSSAGFGIRLAARIIDGVFGVLVYYVGTLAATGSATLQPPGPLSLVLAVVGGVLYHVLAEAVGGASLGKLLLRLRVTSEDLTPCTFKGALIRNTAWFLDAFLFGLPAWRAMSSSLLSQRYGDQWGRTVVMRATAVPPDSRRSTGRLLLGILSGATVWGMLAALSFVLTVK